MVCWDYFAQPHSGSPPTTISQTTGIEWNEISQQDRDQDYQNIQGPQTRNTPPPKKYISSPPFRTPLLEQVTQTSSDSTSSAMAQYYLTRFGNESTEEETRRELAWPHLLRAAELGRPDAELLVAHAHLSPGAQQTETWWDD